MVARAYYKPLRIIVGADGKPPAGCSHSSNSVVCYELGILPLQWALVVERLRTARRVSRSAPLYLRALLQGRGGQQRVHLVLLSCRAAQLLIGERLRHLPDPLLEPAAWEAAWSSEAWPGHLRALRKAAVASPSRAAAIVAQVPEVGPPQGVDEEGSDSDPDEFLCGNCSKVFKSIAACKAHRAKVHGAGL